jgi:diacylglycerol kinase family enzyme
MDPSLEWRGRVTVRVVRAEGLPKPDALVVVSNGGAHLARVPVPPDGPESLKRATAVAVGRDPTWEEELVFPAALIRGQDSSDRCLVLHVKHLAVGGRWTGNNEGEWLGKVTVALADVVVCGGGGLCGAFPILRKGARVASAVLHVEVVAAECSEHDFAAGAFAAPCPRALGPGVRSRVKEWQACYRCQVSQLNGDGAREEDLVPTRERRSCRGGPAHLYLGPSPDPWVLIHYPPGGATCRWLHADEILGARVCGDGGGVEISVLTRPSAASSEHGDSCHELFHLSNFLDAAHVPLPHTAHATAVQACLSHLEMLSRLQAPLNKAVLQQQRGRQGQRVLVLVNPVSGHKAGQKIWTAVQPLLTQADIDYEVKMTQYAGHAQNILAGGGLEQWSAVLVIGGDGTVVETVNALMLLQGHGGATWCEQTTRRPRHSPALALTCPRYLPSLPALATIAAGSECAFAKMVTYVHVLSAAWVLIKGHKESAVDVLRVTQGADVRHAVCGVGWGMGGKLAEESEELRHTFGPARYLVRLDQTPTPKPSTRLNAANARTSEL